MIGQVTVRAQAFAHYDASLEPTPKAFAALREIQRGTVPKRWSFQCRLCREHVEKGNRAFCSTACKDAFYFATSRPYLRLRVWERDRGVCFACGLDCDALERRVFGISSMMRRPAPASSIRPPAELTRQLLVELRKQGFVGYSPGSPRSFWQADHIVPLDDGGSYLLDNVQTLCHPCHAKKTAEQAKRKGKQRRLIGKKFLETEKQLRRSGRKT